MDTFQKSPEESFKKEKTPVTNPVEPTADEDVCAVCGMSLDAFGLCDNPQGEECDEPEEDEDEEEEDDADDIDFDDEETTT